MNEKFFLAIIPWAQNYPDIIAIALVGSHARGTARPDGGEVEFGFTTEQWTCVDPVIVPGIPNRTT